MPSLTKLWKVTPSRRIQANPSLTSTQSNVTPPLLIFPSFPLHRMKRMDHHPLNDVFPMGWWNLASAPIPTNRRVGGVSHQEKNCKRWLSDQWPLTIDQSMVSDQHKFFLWLVNFISWPLVSIFLTTGHYFLDHWSVFLDHWSIFLDHWSVLLDHWPLVL